MRGKARSRLDPSRTTCSPHAILLSPGSLVNVDTSVPVEQKDGLRLVACLFLRAFHPTRGR
eukprot:scaffold2858_cov659-Pavlova_lutheri.AAC.183